MTRGQRIASAVLGGFALAAVLAPLVAPSAPDAVQLEWRRLPPSGSHWFGTDALGRDVLSRVLFGARVSLAVGAFAAMLSVALGAVVGVVAGYARGRVDAVLMRLTDAMLALPRLPLLMLAASMLQPSVAMLVVLIGVVGWMETARVIRSEVLSIVPRGYVEGARATGVPATRLLWRHITPVLAPLLALSATLAVARSLLLESALSFFGVGVQPPAASWGNMLYEGQSVLRTDPWLSFFPGAMIFLCVVCVNVLGDARAARRGYTGMP